MDTLYTGEIPQNYKYAVFNNNYIRLYSQPSAQNETLTYYDIYLNTDEFFYTSGTQNFGQYYRTYFTEIPVSDDWLYRRDIDKIFSVSFIIIIMFLFVFNIITSCIKKGGVFGGLL